ncbi:MAG: hypothetical protein JKY25_01765 [Robiginitomaculum sp.]|nr:hypothetical protein [Robiginitomaculum sp.]
MMEFSGLAQQRRGLSGVFVRSLVLLLVWLGLCGVLLAPLAQAQDFAIDVEYIKRQNVDERLKSYGVGLLGDNIDLNTGSVQFEHVDISLPGNSGLEVAIRRTRGQGFVFPHKDATSYGSSKSSNPFSDWTLEVPRIAMIFEQGGDGKEMCDFDRFGGNFINNPNPPNYGGNGFEIGGNESVWVNDYDISNGTDLIVPGRGSQKLLSSPQGLNWPAGTIRVTKNNWAVKCGPADNGAQGFVATAPNGDVYKFDTYRTRYVVAMPIDGKTPNLSGLGVSVWSTVIPRAEANLLASEVTDVNGNWVRYTYNTQGWLTRIHSNDGRDIQINYDANDLIQTITAHGRTWSYAYSSPQPGTSLLSSVTLPDGRQWMMDLINYTVTPNNCIELSVPDATWKITHPSGVEGTFIFSETRHLKGKSPTGNNRSRNCTTGVMTFTPYFDFMSVKSKTLSGPGYPSATWNYTYSGYNGGGLPVTKWGQVVGPLGRKTKSHYHRATDLEGLEQQQQIYDSGGALMQTTNYTYVVENPVGTTWLENENPGKLTRPRYQSAVVTTRNGDTFTTNNSYNNTQSSSAYSYGNPISTSVSSNVSTTPRTTVTTYEHNTAKWILGLPKTMTTNGRNMSSYVYDSKGRKTSQTRYGAAHATYSYNSDGTILWGRDALGRQTTLYDWKRGTPQRIKRADNVSTYQYVDDNGWLTSSKDARGYTTSYERDTMGRLTKYIPPSPWTATDIAYDFGADISQTITKGNAETTINYDNMFRPILVQTADLLTGQSTYVKSSYNGAGQTVFTSFPSANSNPTDGTNMTYDGLGRILDSTENVAPYAQTKTRYYGSHRTRVHDPAGKFSDYYYTGYDGPNGKTIRGLYQSNDGTFTYTYMTRNDWGEMTNMTQYGNSGGVSVVEYRYYYYDAQRRLCRYRENEGGDTLYKYDVAGQMTSYQKGLAAGSACPAPAGSDKVSLSYDVLGRPTTTNYADAATPDIARSYDNNGNVLGVNRGPNGGSGSTAVNWAYAYDSANNLTSENLSLDGRIFPMSYGYDTSGFMVSRSLPSGRSLAISNDGLGRLVGVSSGGTNYASGTSYHASGAIAGMVYGNGQVFSQTLTARLQPYRLLSQKGASKALDLTYTYDVRGKVTNILNGAMTGDDRTYAYDALGRMISSSGPWGNGSYTYDSLGNIRTKTEGSRSLVMNYDSRNRLWWHTDTGGPLRVFSYDNRGNVTGITGQSFLYDKSNQPVQISGIAGGHYKYDGNKRRVKSIVDGKTIYNVYDASGTLVHIDKVTDNKKIDYIGKFVRIENNVPTYLHMDHLGSAQTGSSVNGTVAWREQYTPFGETLTNPLSNADQAGYTGHIKDSATGLNYMQARYYDPLIGRFLSIDPIGFSPEMPFMFNRYTYVNNDPLNNWDPFGEQVEELEKGKEFSFTAKIQNESSKDLSDEQLQSMGDEIGTVIDGAFSGSKGIFRGDVTMTSDISGGEAGEGETTISIVDEIIGSDGKAIPNVLGAFEGDFGEGGNIKITTFAIEKGMVGKTGGHEFGHSFGNLKHPRGTSFTLMDQSNRSNLTPLRPDQRRRAIRSFQKND